jgi:hypothetical protein
LKYSIESTAREKTKYFFPSLTIRKYARVF